MTPTEVWTEFGERLRRFIVKRVRNEHDADDILQDVFIRLQTGVDGVENLEAWIFQVTRHAVADHFRKRPAMGPATEPVEPRRDEDVAGELASCLLPMLELLEEADRDALRLVDLEGLAQNELAARLGLSITGAKSRVQRARKRLKEILLDCCEVERDRRGNAMSYAPRGSSCSDSCGCR